MSSEQDIQGIDVAFRASSLAISKTLGAIARILGAVALARLLPKEEFGLVSLVLITYVVVSSIGQLGLPESVYYFFEKYKDAKRKVFGKIARLLIRVSLLGGLILMLFAIIASWRGYPIVALMAPLTVLLILDLPATPINHALISVGRAKLAALLNLIYSLALFAALVIPPILKLPIVAISFGLLSYGIVRFAVGYFFFRRHVKGDGTLPDGLAREIFRYALPVGIANLGWKINLVVDKYAVMFLMPITVFAEFSAGAWEFPVAPAIAASVAMVLMPQFVNRYFDRDPQGLLNIWNLSVKKVSLIVLPMMILLVMISEELVVALYSSNYQAAWPVFAVYSMAIFHRVGDYAMLLRAINRTTAITRWAFYNLTLNLVLTVPCLLLFGIVGAAIGFLLASLITWPYVLLQIAKGLQVPIKEVFPFRFYTKTLMVALLSAIPVLYLTPYLPNALEMPGKIICYLASYSLLSSWTGICTRSDWLFISGAIRFLPRKAT